MNICPLKITLFRFKIFVLVLLDSKLILTPPMTVYKDGKKNLIKKNYIVVKFKNMYTYSQPIV